MSTAERPRVPLTARNSKPSPAKLAGIGAVYAQQGGRRALSARPSSSSNRIGGGRVGGANDPLMPYGYATLSPIAQGAFSQVARARHHGTGAEVAVKTFLKNKIAKEPHLAHAMKNELDVLKQLQPSKHENIANVLEVIDTKNSILAILEYCGGGSLQRCLQSRPHASGLGEATGKHIARQICNALAHMHGMGMAHRDVKPENVLFTDLSHKNVKLCDFGFAIACGNRRVRTVCGSPQYMAPELAKREPYHAWGCDMWALGAVIYEMLENKPAFRGSSMEQLNIRIMRASHEAFTSATPAAARALIKGLITLELGNRFPSKQALNHGWFGGSGALPANQCGAITERAPPSPKPMPTQMPTQMMPQQTIPRQPSQPSQPPSHHADVERRAASPSRRPPVQDVSRGVGGFGVAVRVPPVQIPAPPVSSASGGFLP